MPQSAGIRFAALLGSAGSNVVRQFQRWSMSTTHDELHRDRQLASLRASKMSVDKVQRIVKLYYPGDICRPMHYAQILELLSRCPLQEHVLGQRNDRAASIRVAQHTAYKDERNMCFAAVRYENTECIFSYRLCMRANKESGTWKIFRDAAKRELDVAGVLKKMKAVKSTFERESPGQQLSFHFDKLLQKFCDRKHILLGSKLQLLALVERDAGLHMRVRSHEPTDELLSFAVEDVKRTFKSSRRA